MTGLIGRSQHHRNCAVIAGVFCTKTPVDGVAVAVEVERPVPFGVVAFAAVTLRLATAIIVGHQIIAAVRGIVTGSDPGDRRGLRARWTGGIAAAAAGAQKPTECAIAPVIATLRIADFLNGALRKGPFYRKQGKSGSAGDQHTQS